MEDLEVEEGENVLDAELEDVLRENNIPTTGSEPSRARDVGLGIPTRQRRPPRSIPERQDQRGRLLPGEGHRSRLTHSTSPDPDRASRAFEAITGNASTRRSVSSAPSTTTSRNVTSRARSRRASLIYQANVRHLVPSMTRIKSSEEALLSQRLVHAVCTIHLKFTWLVLGPGLIGQDPMQDTAALAFSQATELHMLRRAGLQNLYLMQSASSNYAKALGLLKSHLAELDGRVLATTAAVAWLLGHSDILIDVDGFCFASSFYHQVIEAYLFAQSQIEVATDPLTRALFQDMCRWEYIRACARETQEESSFPVTESPFNADNWAAMQPFSFRSREGFWDQLQMSAQRMIVRLRHFSRAVKAVREASAEGTAVDISETVGLAEALLSLQNVEAEKEMLQSITTIPTRDEGLKRFVPESFDLDEASWTAASRYWSALMAVIRLSLLLNSAFSRHERLWLSPERAQTLLETQDQVLYRILVMAQFCWDRGMLSKLQVVHSVIIGWACLFGREKMINDQDVVAKELQDEMLAFLRERGDMPSGWRFESEELIAWVGLLAATD